jgi:ribonuclease HI
MKLYFDGSRTDTATGYGFVLERNNQIVLEQFNTIPVQGTSNTSNVAEYAGIIAGINAAATLLEPNEALQILGDSQLVIRQVLGEYKVKVIHLIPLSDLAKNRIEYLRKKGHEISLKWIRREFNKQADKLASKASNKCAARKTSLGDNQGQPI